MVIGLFSLTAVGFSERTLDLTEIVQILETVTVQPQEGWIPYGNIEAVHESYHEAKVTDPDEINLMIEEALQEYQDNPGKREKNADMQQMHYEAIPFNIRYKYGNKYQMTTRETVRYDGSRFKWEIDVLSRQDSVKPPVNNHFMYDYFNLDGNAKRVFAWDGEKYSRYFQSANHASVDENPASIPVRVNGPLTVGCIPWGSGIYELDRITAATLSGVEIVDNDQAEIHVTAVYSPELQVSFVFDPSLNYALLHCTITKPNLLIINQSYDDYQWIDGQWIPFSIVIEKFKGDSTQLLTRDSWTITAVDLNLPAAQSFTVDYKDDALIEYRGSSSPQSQKYLHVNSGPANNIDVESLLNERQLVAGGAIAQPVNCATLAMKYVTQQLGNPVTDEHLASLVGAPNNQTSLLALKQFAQNTGFYALAVKTDIATLKSLQNCQVILHLAANNHYVALAGIDDEYIRLIDLSRDNFLYRRPVTTFWQDWQDGTALILANEPINANGALESISLLDQQMILGAGCQFGCYSCTDLLQEYDILFCSLPSGGICDGVYIIYEERWGCESAASGSCYSSVMPRRNETPCINNPQDPLVCTIEGTWTTYYMRACN